MTQTAALTQEERAEIRALCDGATPGPWAWSGNDIDGGEHGLESVIEMEVSCGVYCLGGSVSMRASGADRAFIAAARTALPRLLDALEAAERERDEARRMLSP
jgi:hypothetical protein